LKSSAILHGPDAKFGVECAKRDSQTRDSMCEERKATRESSTSVIMRQPIVLILRRSFAAELASLTAPAREADAHSPLERLSCDKPPCQEFQFRRSAPGAQNIQKPVPASGARYEKRLICALAAQGNAPLLRAFWSG
jgi:hypothetical protein